MLLLPDENLLRRIAKVLPCRQQQIRQLAYLLWVSQTKGIYLMGFVLFQRGKREEGREKEKKKKGAILQNVFSPAHLFV
jgi:hypothetical protein